MSFTRPVLRREPNPNRNHPLHCPWCAGEDLFPNEIEAAIKRHARVLDVAVIRYPDRELGEVPAAIVQPKEGQTLSSGEIIDFCRQQSLQGFKIPRYVEIVESLPRHIDGKMRKKDIEDRYWAEIERRG